MGLCCGFSCSAENLASVLAHLWGCDDNLIILFICIYFTSSLLLLLSFNLSVKSCIAYVHCFISSPTQNKVLSYLLSYLISYKGYTANQLTMILKYKH